jgi:hypothetical protein
MKPNNRIHTGVRRIDVRRIGVRRKDVRRAAFLSIIFIGGFAAAWAQTLNAAAEPAAVTTAALWQDRGDISTLNLTDGVGGADHRPSGRFLFVEEDKEGTSPKFEVTDAAGTRWKVKLGEETKSETAATRLVWAAGYFTDEDYYLPTIRVAGIPNHLDRGREFVTPDGLVRGVRMERKLKGQKKGGTWSWFDNPLAGTRELNGLKVMMALIDNWDLKEVNNAVYDDKSGQLRYVVSDLGASFGKTGNSLTRSKSNPDDYSKSKFIQKVSGSHVDFFMSSRPFVLSAVNVPNYLTRTHMQEIVKDIPVDDARWLGKLLAGLSGQQITDCFRAAGYSPEEVTLYSTVVRERIMSLSRL